MTPTALEPAAWLVAIFMLAACWPLAQRARHENLHPLAAYLLFAGRTSAPDTSGAQPIRGGRRAA